MPPLAWGLTEGLPEDAREVGGIVDAVPPGDLADGNVRSCGGDEFGSGAS